ncbi:hypothetical protein M3Y97_00790100 [Aphelenchoides bicaudatus]|nr:hypothetical protein M3Y97_00790100 [Aphelenchoides bicaudatus]
MWHTALDYNSPPGYNSTTNNTSNSFFGNSFSDNEIKMNDANFSNFQHQLAMSLTGTFPFIHQGFASSSPSSIENTPQIRAKKKPVPIAPEKKTQAYFDRRKKNNQSAQKSRNERRRREQDNVLRINQLEQENNVLRSMLQQLQSKLNFQELHLQSLQSRNDSATEIERRQTSASNCSTTGAQQVPPFSNQMSMLMNNPY